MTSLRGAVSAGGFHKAGWFLAHVEGLIEERTGLANVVPGTLNVELSEAYFVRPDTIIGRDEYNDAESLLLERCCIGGIRAVIIRPDSHERGNAHGPAHLELMAEVKLRDALGLEDGAAVEVVVGEELPCWDESQPSRADDGLPTRGISE